MFLILLPVSHFECLLKIFFINNFLFNLLLAWLLVVELPWILSAAWKIVKSWLSPEAVNKIRYSSIAQHSVSWLNTEV